MKIIRLLVYSYLVLFPFGQLLRIPPQSKSYSEIHLYLTDIVVFCAGLLLIACYSFLRTQINWVGIVKPVLFFFFIGLFSLLISPLSLNTREYLVSSLYMIRWIFYAGLFFAVLNQSDEFKNKIKYFLPLVGFVCAILGIIQYFVLPDTRFISDYGWDPHYYRLIGTFLDPGFLGLILVFSLIILTIDLFARKNRFKQAIWILIYLALALTYSRGSYLAYLTAMSFISWKQKAVNFFIFVLIVGAITIFLLPRPGGESTRLERDSTIRLRITSWQHALIVASEHPVLGIGFNAYRYAQRQYGFMNNNVWEVSNGAPGADSSLLFILATTGMVGLLVYLYLGVKLIRLSRDNIIIYATIIALLVHSWFQNSLFYPWIMGWMWILLGSQVREQK